MSEQDYETIAQAVTALKYHDEENIAEQLSKVQTERMERAQSRIHTLKKVAFWSTLGSLLLVGVGGVALAAVRGDLIAAAGFSIYLFIFTLIVGLLSSFLDGATEWFKNFTNLEADDE